MQQQIRLSKPEDAYKKQGVLTSSPIELIILLYDALKKNLLMAKRYIGKGNTESAHKHLIKAQDIVSELLNCLDMSFSLSKELMSLYEFMLAKLAEANAAKDAELLEPVMTMVDELRETWKEVAETQKGTMTFGEG